MPKPSEKDIGSAVMRWLTNMGWDCYPEAQVWTGGPRADIAAKRDFLLWIVECKTSASLALLSQAMRWIGRAHYVSVAIPFLRNEAFRRICADYGIGVFIDSSLSNGIAREASYRLRPRLNRSAHAMARYVIERLHPDMKRYAPGTKANDGYSTPWSRTMRHAIETVQAFPGIDLKTLIERTDHHYQTASTAKQCLRKWLEVDDRVEVRRERRKILFYPAQ